MKAKYEDKETDVTNLMADKVDQLLEEIYASDLKPGETYEVNTENMIEDAKAEAALLAGNWNMAPRAAVSPVTIRKRASLSSARAPRDLSSIRISWHRRWSMRLTRKSLMPS